MALSTAGKVFGIFYVYARYLGGSYRADVIHIALVSWSPKVPQWAGLGLRDERFITPHGLESLRNRMSEEVWMG